MPTPAGNWYVSLAIPLSFLLPPKVTTLQDSRGSGADDHADDRDAASKSSYSCDGSGDSDFSAAHEAAQGEPLNFEELTAKLSLTAAEEEKEEHQTKNRNAPAPVVVVASTISPSPTSTGYGGTNFHSGGIESRKR